MNERWFARNPVLGFVLYLAMLDAIVEAIRACHP